MELILWRAAVVLMAALAIALAVAGPKRILARVKTSQYRAPTKIFAIFGEVFLISGLVIQVVSLWIAAWIPPLPPETQAISSISEIAQLRQLVFHLLDKKAVLDVTLVAILRAAYLLSGSALLVAGVVAILVARHISRLPKVMTKDRLVSG